MPPLPNVPTVVALQRVVDLDSDETNVRVEIVGRWSSGDGSAKRPSKRRVVHRWHSALRATDRRALARVCASSNFRSVLSVSMAAAILQLRAYSGGGGQSRSRLQGC